MRHKGKYHPKYSNPRSGILVPVLLILLITLVICTYHVENGRFVLVARKK